MDNKRISENHDPLKKNKPFSRLFEDDNENWFYISNDLTCDQDFMTTSITAYDPDAAERAAVAERGFLGIRRKKEKWVLPYRSTIACIVRQGMIQAMPGEKPVAVGFLTSIVSRGTYLKADGTWRSCFPLPTLYFIRYAHI